MNSYMFVIAFCSVFALNQSLQFNQQLVSSFLKHYNLKFGIIFYCKFEDISGWESFVKNELKYFAFFDISSEKFDLNHTWRMMKYDNHELGIVFDTTCNETETVFNEFSNFNCFNASYYWLMMSESFESSVELLKAQNLNLDAEITLAVQIDNSTQLYDAYNPNSRTDGKLVVHPKGFWSELEGLNITMRGSKFDRRSNLNGALIHTGIVAAGVEKNQTLFQYLETDDRRLIEPQHRHAYRIFKILSEKHNFRMHIHRTTLWGYLRNGSFNGVMGMFQKKQIELSITPLSTFAVERLDVIDFTVVTWTSTSTIVFRHPDTGLRNVFFQPLDPYVWAFIVVVIFTFSVIITISMRFQHTKGQNVTIMRALILSFGIICQQGIIENYKKPATRVVEFTLILFSLISYQFYSSFIVGSLLTDPPKSINTLRQLIDSKLEVGIENTTYNTEHFQTTKDPTTIELYKKKIKGHDFLEATEGVKRMQKGEFAFHVDTSYAYKTISDLFDNSEICQLHEMFLFPVRALYPGVLKDSPLKELITVGILRLAERGIIVHHTRKWSADKPKCIKSLTKIKAVDIKQASTIFIILAFAIILSLICLVLEIVHHRYYYARLDARPHVLEFIN